MRPLPLLAALLLTAPLLARPAAAQLAGTYTIDGSQPTGGTNFASVRAAADSLEVAGVSGPVTFEVAYGTYASATGWNLLPVPGVSAARPVRFVRAPGTPDRPVVAVPVGNPIKVHSDHVTFEGLEITALWFVSAAHSGVIGGRLQRVIVEDSEDILIENNVITGYATGSSLASAVRIIGTSADVAIRYNRIEPSITAVRLAGGARVLIEHNVINIPDLVAQVAHGIYGDGGVRDLTIRRNAIRKAETNVGSWAILAYDAQGDVTIEANEVFSEEGGGVMVTHLAGGEVGRLALVNNAVLAETAQGVRLDWYDDAAYPVAVTHNTILVGSLPSSGLQDALTTDGGHFDLSHNVVVALNASGRALRMDGVIRSLDYDVLYAASGLLAELGEDTYADLAALQAGTPFEDHGASFLPDFEDVLGGDLHVVGGDDRLAAPRLASVLTDVDGDARPGVTYRGADEAPVPLTSRLHVHVFLQGPYVAGSRAMHDRLNDAGLVPLAQPYNAHVFDGTPLYHDGGEATTAAVLAAHDVVDWVLVELRAAPDGAPLLRRAALLRVDGLVLDANGEEGVALAGLPAAEAYVAVYHRNHLGAMVPAPTALYGGATAVLADGVYGAGGGVEIEPDIWALWGGNGDGDGGVLAPDRQAVWEPAVGQTGYTLGDYTLDGRVLADDRQVIWEPNVGAQSAIPGQSLAPEGPRDGR